MNDQKPKVTRKHKKKVRVEYEILMIIEDLLLNEKEEDNKERLRMLRKDVIKLAYINKQIHPEEEN